MFSRGNSDNQKKHGFVAIYRDALRALSENPMIGILFLLIAIIDLIALMVLFLAPSEPVSFLLAPIIKTFWSDKFLHYPNNFILLPKLYSHAHFLILSLFGLITSGIAIKKIEAFTNGENLPVSSAAETVFKKYFSLLVAWLVSYGIFTFLLKHLLLLVPSFIALQLVIGFILAVVIQALFSFLLPAILLSENGFFPGLWTGLSSSYKNFVAICKIIAAPLFVIAMLSFSKAFAPLYVTFHPEIVLWILILGVFISMVVDILITLSTTILFLKVRKS